LIALDVEALRTQLRKIIDDQLREFSNASKGTGRRGVQATRSPSASEVGVILHEDWVYLVALA
jgi:hypothetical protein